MLYDPAACRYVYSLRIRYGVEALADIFPLRMIQRFFRHYFRCLPQNSHYTSSREYFNEFIYSLGWTYKFSVKNAVWPCGLPIRLLPPRTIRQSAANELPIPFLPPDRVAQVSQHQLSFLHQSDNQNIRCHHTLFYSFAVRLTTWTGRMFFSGWYSAEHFGGDFSKPDFFPRIFGEQKFGG